MFDWLGRLFSKKATYVELQLTREVIQSLEREIEYLKNYTRWINFSKRPILTRNTEGNIYPSNNFELTSTFKVANDCYEVWVEKDKPTKKTDKKPKKKAKKK